MTASKYKPEYCDLLIEHMSMGKSFESFGAKVKVGRTTLYDWLDQHKDWKEAKGIAEACALDFLETRAVAKISGQKFNNQNFDPKNVDTAMTIFALKTRFHRIYGDKSTQDINMNIDGPVFVEDDDGESSD